MAVRQQQQIAQKEKATAAGRKSQTADLLGAFAKSTVRAIGSQVGRQIMRGIFGSMLGARKIRITDIVEYVTALLQQHI